MSADMDERITIGPARIRTEAIDLDINGLVLTVITIDGRDILAQGEGGSGWWIEYDSDEPTEIDDVGQMDFTANLPDTPDDKWSHISGTLHRWVENKTPLRMIALFRDPRIVLLWDGETMIPLPRS